MQDELVVVMMMMLLLLLLLLHVVRCANKLRRVRHCRLLLSWGWEGRMRYCGQGRRRQ
jgi:hypothetical protein